MGYEEPSIAEINSEFPESLTEILREVNIKNPGVKTVYVDKVKNRIGFDEEFNKCAVEYCWEETDRFLKLARSRKKAIKTEGYKEIITI